MNTPQQKRYTFSLIGDNGIDEYQYGTVERLSAEAPVPIFNYKYSIMLPGMAANVEKNLAALGVNTVFHTKEVCKKVRLIDEKFKHHMIRIDHDVQSEPFIHSEVYLNVDAIVVSDYLKGTISYELIDYLKNAFSGPIFVDTKKPDLARLNAPNVFVKINEPEFAAAISYCDNIIVTRGGDNVLLFEKCRINPLEFAVKDVPIFDVCGAGDTFLAALAYRYVYTKDLSSAIQFAIRAASITVQHIGVYAPTLEEIYELDKSC